MQDVKVEYVSDPWERTPWWELKKKEIGVAGLDMPGPPPSPGSWAALKTFYEQLAYQQLNKSNYPPPVKNILKEKLMKGKMGISPDDPIPSSLWAESLLTEKLK